MDWDYLNDHPSVERAARLISQATGKNQIYNLEVCLLLWEAPRVVVEAYQYIWGRNSVPLATICDFILALRFRKGEKK